ncbi:MAG: 3-dehydroquinate synthase [Clostridia bacterium]|nr:3-dehydroquinate synthase [Clostridia bacterium]
MRKVTVNASKTYDIIIKKGAIDLVGNLTKDIIAQGKVCVISDSNVAPLYMERVKNSLSKEGIKAKEYVFPAGEKSKNAQTYIEILNFLAQGGFTRKDTLIALGGGVTGDLTGFCAATYMRGIKFIQLPTSLLAAVDSSVGGKTGIDLSCGKNLAGAFYQPSMVIFDSDVLKTLSKEYFADGMAEVIKYAMIKGEGLDKLILAEELDIEEIVERCVKIKRDIVNADEFESGIRQILNFGHTVGHAIEAQSDYTISHGRCVAMGMYIVTKAYKCENLCKQLFKMLEKFNLKTNCPYTPKEILERAKKDKKADSSGVNLIVSKEMGKCEIVKITMDELLLLIKEGMK